MNIRIQKGFTLLEILLVIAAIGILAAIVLVAINPNRQIAQARNAQRRSDINTIYKALEQYLMDNKEYPTDITDSKKDICDTGTEQSGSTATDCSGKADLRILVPTYLASIPKDPSGGVYKVYKNSANNRIGVEAAGAELGQSLVLNPIATAIGGNITTINENGIWYKVHTFRTNGTFTVTGGSLNVEYLVVGGGGGGGYSGNGGGGGGAGGFRNGTTTALAQAYTFTVGAGGAIDASGSSSSAFGIEGAGGGRGATTTQTGNEGASGGGGSIDGANPGRNGNVPSTTPSQGNGGGTSPSGGWIGAAGGGGAGSVGANGGGGSYPPTATFAGDGGTGKEWPTGSGTYYAGGGGGHNTGNADADKRGDGVHGGGYGGTDNTGTKFADAANGTANTGGGGGGGRQSSSALAGAGGSGIVIVRYIIPAP